MASSYRPAEDRTGARGQLATVGGAIRGTRLRRGMALSALSEATSLDKGYLSRIERGQKAPSLAALLSIAGALDLSVHQMLGDVTDPSAVRFGRAGAGGAILAGGQLAAELLILNAEPMARNPDEPGEVMLFVVDGSVTVAFPDMVHELAAGDCLSVDGHSEHRISSPCGGARLLVVSARDGVAD